MRSPRIVGWPWHTAGLTVMRSSFMVAPCWKSMAGGRLCQGWGRTARETPGARPGVSFMMKCDGTRHGDCDYRWGDCRPQYRLSLGGPWLPRRLRLGAWSDRPGGDGQGDRRDSPAILTRDQHTALAGEPEALRTVRGGDGLPGRLSTGRLPLSGVVRRRVGVVAGGCLAAAPTRRTRG